MNRRERLARTALTGLGRIAPRAAAPVAVRYFSTPAARGPLRPAEEPVMRQATRDRLYLGDTPIAVYAWGDGSRPVLLMHGWRSRASRFAPLVTALRERGYSPVAFDAPGHGDSGGRSTTILDYRDIARRLHARHGRFAALVGHSVGGAAAFFAVRGQAMADRLVSIAAPADFAYVVEEFCRQLGAGPRLQAAVRQRIERRVFPGESDIFARFSASHRPGDLALPILVIHDDGDDVIAPGQGRRLAAAHGQHADLITTSGLGHRRIIADPEVIDAVLAFAAATDPAGREPAKPEPAKP